MLPAARARRQAVRPHGLAAAPGSWRAARRRPDWAAGPGQHRTAEPRSRSRAENRGPARTLLARTGVARTVLARTVLARTGPGLAGRTAPDIAARERRAVAPAGSAQLPV